MLAENALTSLVRAYARNRPVMTFGKRIAPE